MDKAQTKQTQPDPIPGVDLNRSIRTRAARGARLLSPWVQRWLRPDSPAGAVRQPAFLQAQQPVMLTQAGTGFFLHRMQRLPERSLAWKPNVGSLKPGMTDPLTHKIAGRAHFKPVGVKLKNESAPEQAALNYGEEPEFTLPGRGGMVSAGTDFAQEVQQKGSLLDAIREQGDEVSARVPEILRNLPRSGGQLIPPAPRQRKKTVRERPNISPKSRLFTAVQEVDAGRSTPEPEQPPAAPAIEPDDDTGPQPALGPDPPGPPPEETSQPELLFLQAAQKPKPGRETKPLPPDAAVPLAELPEPPVLLPPAKKPSAPVIKPDRPPVAEPERDRTVITPNPPAQTLEPMPETKRFSPRLIRKKQAAVTESEQTEVRKPLPVFLPEQPVSPAASTPPPAAQAEWPATPMPLPEQPVSPAASASPPVQVEFPSLPLGAAVQLEANKKSLPGVKPDPLPAGSAPEMRTPAPAKINAARPGQPGEVPGQLHLRKSPLSEPPHPLLHLYQTITKRAETPLPLLKPRRPNQPAPRRIKPSPQPPAITPQAARLQLASRGWRFKTGPVDRPGEAKRIIQTAASLENPGGTGAPLADEPRAAMEGTLGRDFGDVRVHRADLGPLNVQAATRGRDVFFDKGQDNFDRPEGMALLGHELTHVGQSSAVQTKPQPEAGPPVVRLPAEVRADEAEANRVEQTVYRQAQTGSLPLARPLIQRAAIPDLEPDSGPYLNDSGEPESYAQVQNRQPTYPEDLFNLETGGFEEQQTDNEAVFAGLQDTLEEMIDERMAQLMNALSLAEPEETTAPPGPDTLARQILPFLKRLIVVERERRAF